MGVNGDFGGSMGDREADPITSLKHIYAHADHPLRFFIIPSKKNK